MYMALSQFLLSKNPSPRSNSVDLLSLLFFFIVCLVLGMEPRALHMLDKCSTTELHPPSSLPYHFFSL